MWDEARKDVANGAMATMDDLVDAISTAKKGFFGGFYLVKTNKYFLIFYK